METDEKDNYDQSEPKRIKLENESADSELEDSQNWQPQRPLHQLRCHKCPDNFATAEEIIHHWTELHGLRPANCSVCNAHFPSIKEMWDHKMVTHGLPCELCENFFETGEKLTDHVKLAHLNAPNMDDDGRDRQGVKSTEYMEEKTAKTLNLPTNSKTILEAKPQHPQSERVYRNSIKVSTSKNKSLKGRSNRTTRRMMNQVDVKPYCILCKLAFPSKRLKRKHRITVHGIACKICNKKFRKQEGAQNHARDVHGVDSLMDRLVKQIR